MLINGQETNVLTVGSFLLYQAVSMDTQSGLVNQSILM